MVSLVGAQKASLHPDDMLLLANFVTSSESFRQVWLLQALLHLVLVYVSMSLLYIGRPTILLLLIHW